MSLEKGTVASPGVAPIVVRFVREAETFIVTDAQIAESAIPKDAGNGKGKGKTARERESGKIQRHQANVVAKAQANSSNRHKG